MEYTEEFLKKIVGVGTLGYSLSKIINVLDIEEKDVKQFTEDFDKEGSPFKSPTIKALIKRTMQLT